MPAFRIAPTHAQQTAGEVSRNSEFDNKIRSFFEALSKNNNASAIEELLRQSPLGSPSASQQQAELVKQIEDITKQFGSILNWEKIDSKRVGDDIVILHYVLKCEQYPLIWTFTFYRKPLSPSAPPITQYPWTIIELNFHTDLDTYSR
jgi:hypothetical protein